MSYDFKYLLKEGEETESFHRQRRIFCINNNILYIAEPNFPHSHAVWFEQKGWINQTKDELMEKMVRGMVSPQGDVYFYRGYDFRIDKESEDIFFKHLESIVKELSILPEAKVYGGFNLDPKIPIKFYGLVKKLIKD